jgi:hypothetical protein
VLLALSQRRSSGQFGFDLFDDVAKSHHVMHSQIGQHFAVDFDLGFFQAVGELAVG